MKRRAVLPPTAERPPGIYPPGPVEIPDEATMLRRLAAWEDAARPSGWGRACGDVAHEPKGHGSRGEG